MLSLHLVYQDNAGKAVSATQVKDRSLLVQAAKKAISEARDRAKEMRKLNPLIGRFQRQEAERLERLLTTLIPELERASKDHKEIDHA